jgi:hypothetical protein
LFCDPPVDALIKQVERHLSAAENRVDLSAMERSDLQTKFGIPERAD